MIVVKGLKQCSPEWFAARAGIPSASCFKEILTATRKIPTGRKKYMHTLCGEKYTGKKAEGVNMSQMQRGMDLEPEARHYLAFSEGLEFEQVGIVYHDEKKLYSCSPDGLLPDRGLEIKCPYLGTHTKYLIDQKLPTEYFVQVQGSMLVTGLDKWEFMSYHPDMPPFRITVARDDDFCDLLKQNIDKFCDELGQLNQKLASVIGD